VVGHRAVSNRGTQVVGHQADSKAAQVVVPRVANHTAAVATTPKAALRKAGAEAVRPAEGTVEEAEAPKPAAQAAPRQCGSGGLRPNVHVGHDDLDAIKIGGIRAGTSSAWIRATAYLCAVPICRRLQPIPIRPVMH
jgi:hypothetical protein